jgi:hypothetical protein
MKYSKMILTSSNETARNGDQKNAPVAARMAPAEYKAAAPGSGFIMNPPAGNGSSCYAARSLDVSAGGEIALEFI